MIFGIHKTLDTKSDYLSVHSYGNGQQLKVAGKEMEGGRKKFKTQTCKAILFVD